MHPHGEIGAIFYTPDAYMLEVSSGEYYRTVQCRLPIISTLRLLERIPRANNSHEFSDSSKAIG